jgi:serine/threonine protein kinase
LPIPGPSRRRARLKQLVEEDPRFKGTNISEIMDIYPDHMVRMNPDVTLLPVCFETDVPEANSILKVYHDNSKERAKEVYNIRKRTSDSKHLVSLATKHPISLSNNIFGILMELYDGDLWHDFLLEQRRLDEEKFLKLLIDMVDGISSLHKKGIIHSDIKPTNILASSLDFPGWVLTDFGSANMGFTYLTMSGKNPECFRSPELRESIRQGKGFTYNKQEDIFAFGVTLYIALTRKEYGFENERKGLNLRGFIDKTIRDSDFDPVIKEILKMFLGPKRPDTLPRGRTWKDYRYDSGVEAKQDLGERFLNFHGFQGADFGEEEPSIELYPNSYLSFLEIKDKMLELVSKEYQFRNQRWNGWDFEYVDRLVGIHSKFARYSAMEEVRSVEGAIEKIKEADKKYKEIKISEAKRLLKQLRKLNKPQNPDFEAIRDISDLIYNLGWPSTHRERSGLETKTRYTKEEIKTGNLPYQKRVNRREKEFKKYS